jgi:hypothetical protein
MNYCRDTVKMDVSARHREAFAEADGRGERASGSERRTAIPTVAVTLGREFMKHPG